MIEGIGAISAVEPVSLSIASALSSRQGVVRREKRLRWLKSLHDVQGGASLIDAEDAAELEREAEDRALAEMRERIATTLSMVEAMSGFSQGVGGDRDSDSHGTISAAELALRIGAAGNQSLRIQARLGSAVVRQLVG